MQDSTLSKLQYIPLLLAGVFLISLSHFYFLQIGDDSYIYFRYVDRALAGEWGSWTSHIPAVEGYSSPLWYGLLVLSSSLGFSAEAAGRLLGLLFSFLSFYGCWRLSRLLSLSVFWSGCACLFLVLNQGFHFWSTSGLETPMYSAIYVWLAIGLVQERNWVLPLSLVGIARPEGVVLMPAIMLAIAVFKKERLNLKWLAVAAVPTCAWLAFRLSHYGLFFPNTYYAKASDTGLSQLLKGVFYALPALMLTLLSWCFWFRNRQHDAMVVLGLILMLLGIVVIGGGDWMYFDRLSSPVYALLFPVMFLYLASSALKGRLLLALGALLFVFGMVPPAYVIQSLAGAQLPVHYYQEGNMTHKSIELADDIRQLGSSGLIAVNHAGALPWAMPEFDFIDMVGLNDGHIAQVEGRLHHKYDAEYVMASKPDFIVLNTRTKPGTDSTWYHKGYWVGEDAVVDHPDFERYYEATPIAKHWSWQIPFPYNRFVQYSEDNWIVVYQRVEEK